MSAEAEAKKRSRRNGQAVVEFALVLPLFVLLVFGALEFGRAYYNIHLLTNAAREGAREGSLPGKLEADVEQKVDSFLNGVGLSGTWTTGVTVTAPDGTERSGLAAAQEGDAVAVGITYQFTVLSGSVLPGFSGTVPLEGRCVFRHE
ncbi:MAG: TadE/TadG family type IV pilus assembly protein [Planctomycetota bacterium]